MGFMDRMKKIDRSKFFRPLRDISNFMVYRRYVKQFDVETKEGRKWLYELDRNIKMMGFNYGVETFETYYESRQKIGRSQVQNKLMRDLRMAEFHDDQRQLEIAQNEAQAKWELERLKKEEQSQKPFKNKKPFNPNWKPTAQMLRSRNTRYVSNPYSGFIRKEYEAPEHGAYAVMFEVEGKVKEIIWGASNLDVIAKANRFENDYARTHQLSQISGSSAREIKARRRDEYEIDISHVNRAMGNTESSSRDNDIDNIIDGLF
ncbi:gp503 [Bacillus phage G]|uniref:Gp503 n=1 Tax=Bacillus phage G TaxID=2884420 RepID=G3MAP4_9CAUD|nr:gp503 [Bacillus phage G]AEO93761.1 gp503 [Bacillus phage G]